MVRFTLLVAFALVAACTKPTPVMMWVDGFEPDNIRFEIEDLGPTDAAVLVARGKQGDVDGSAFLPANSCDGPCRAVLVTAFITNRTANKEPPPVMRLAVPPGRAPRLPIAFGGDAIDPGRVGRVRFLVEMWPEERDLTATLSSSVRLDFSTPTPTTPTPPTPATAPTTPATP